jgi:hypothetical protein
MPNVGGVTPFMQITVLCNCNKWAYDRPGIGVAYH